MQEIASFILIIIIYPFVIIADLFFFDAHNRFYWVAILIGLGLAVACRQDLSELVSNKSVWWSDSAKMDYQIAVVSPILLGLFSIYVINLSDVAQTFEQSAVKWLKQFLEVSPPSSLDLVLGAVLTVVLFIVQDFKHWFVHYIFHKVPALWSLHKVHHSAEVLNFVTASRFHPLEVLITTAISLAFLAGANILFIACLPHTPDALTLFGANAIYFILNLAGGTLRHSPIYFSYGPFWEKYLVSPAMHQLHHSSDPRHFDKNFGGLLSIWDRMFGTIAYAHNDEIKAVGIGEESAIYHTMFGAYVRPVVEFFNCAVPKRFKLLNKTINLFSSKKYEKTTRAG